MILDDTERARFIAYAKVQVESAEAILEQLKLIDAPSSIVTKHKMLKLAYGIVSADLESIEVQEIGI